LTEIKARRTPRAQLLLSGERREEHGAANEAAMGIVLFAMGFDLSPK
jgi:hypothetical protein